MINCYQKTHINNPATGIIQKSNPNSFFLQMHNNSELAKDVFSRQAGYRGKIVVVLQVLLMNNEWLMVELVDKEHL